VAAARLCVRVCMYVCYFEASQLAISAQAIAYVGATSSSDPSLKRWLQSVALKAAAVNTLLRRSTLLHLNTILAAKEAMLALRPVRSLQEIVIFRGSLFNLLRHLELLQGSWKPPMGSWEAHGSVRNSWVSPAFPVRKIS